MKILQVLRDAVWPHCSMCNRRLFRGFDRIAELRRLKPLLREYEPTYDGYKHLCEKCWKTIATVQCDLCQTSFDVFALDNQIDNLRQNLGAHSVELPEVSRARRVCHSCRTQRLHCRCARCSRPFPSRDDAADNYKSNADVATWLAPYHRDWQQNWAHLCPACFDDCLAACKNVEASLSQGIEVTDRAHFPGYRLVETLGRVDYKGNDCDQSTKLEERLKLYAAQLGGNAFINFSWLKREEYREEEVRGGYGPKGNPWYKKKRWTERWFTGYAFAVVVEPIATQRPTTVKRADGSGGGSAGHNVKQVVLDGMNICCWVNPNECYPDLRVLTTLALELTHRKILFQVFSDASLPHKLEERKDESAAAYKRMRRDLPQLFLEVPGKTQADMFILQRADSDNCHVISNDQYRDYADRHPWVLTGDHLIKGMVVADRLQIPPLDIDIPIMPNVAAVVEVLLKTIALRSEVAASRSG